MSAAALAKGGTPAPGRWFLIDALKALGCVLIIWHHLVFYGPMSDVVQPYAPELVSWLYDHARMVVQVFLVVGGFLAAAHLAPAGLAALQAAPGTLILRRYRRLVVPLLAALVLAIGATALVRPWFDDPSLSGVPQLPQLMAHALLLQDVLGMEALSAGVWYVAIDFQLYALVVLLFWCAQQVSRRWAGSSTAHAAALTVSLVALPALLSLFWWNRVQELDVTALYFFGAYGLGMLAFWAGGARRPQRWALAMLACGVPALLLEWRARIAVALATALLLAVAGAGRRRQAAPPRSSAPLWRVAVQGLARVSYSVFLVHFSVVLLANAVVSWFWPDDPWINALGMVAAFGLSLLAGWLLHVVVECRPATRRMVLTLQAVLLLSGMAVLTLEAGG